MRTWLRGKISLLFLTCAVVLAVPAIALADNIQNDVVAGGTDTITTGSSTTINYQVKNTSAGGSGFSGCDASDGSSLTLTINKPAAVTASTGSLTFNSCDTPKPVQFSSNTPGDYDITVSASDTHGNYNVNGAAFTLHVTNPPPPPNTAPTLTLPSNPTAEATGPGGAAVSFNATANDAQDGALTPTCTPASGSNFPLGSTQVDCSVTDSGGLTTSGFFAVTVQDTTAPSLNLPPDQTAEATGPNGAAVTFDDPTANDIVDGSITPNCDAASGDQFPLGTTTVHCTATDAHGNSTSGSFTVTVTDNTPPTLNLPNNQTAEATGPGGATVNFTATANDIVDGSITPDCDAASGDQFPLGTTTVHCTATDNAGNTANGSFTVTVEDTTAPDLTLPDNITKEATSASGATATFTASATDLVDGSVSVDCTRGTPPAAVSSGATFALGTTTVNCSATDAAGNTANGSFDVIVQDTTAPAISGMPSNMSLTATSTAGAQATWTAPTATDLVDGNVSVNCTKGTPPVAVNSGDTFPVGTTTVTCTATDAHNNTASKSFTITVTYGWSNFLQPINVPPATQSIFKMGSTVPVKFNLTGASSGITDGTFYLKYAYTGSGDNNGEMESVATTTGTTGTQFRYSEGQYIYNWSTKGVVTKPGNYELRVYSDAAGTVLLGKVSIELKK